MNKTDESLRSHYVQQGDLYDKILQSFMDTKTSIFSIEPDMLAGIDEFHLGGKATTEALADSLDLRSGDVLLDIGCGIGGTARTLAQRFGCKVVGVDLIPEFVTVATRLSKLVGLDEATIFLDGDAAGLIYEAGHFSAVTMLHVGMNISNKAVVMSEMARVLEPGGRLAIFDIMRVDDGDLIYPMPWASHASESYVSTPEEYEVALSNAGFTFTRPVDRTQMVMAELEKVAASPQLLNLGLLMGEQFSEKTANLYRALETGILAPVEIAAWR